LAQVNENKIEIAKQEEKPNFIVEGQGADNGFKQFFSNLFAKIRNWFK